jgi:hypothetical protein
VKLENSALKLVRAGAGDHVDHRAVRVAVLGAETSRKVLVAVM